MRKRLVLPIHKMFQVWEALINPKGCIFLTYILAPFTSKAWISRTFLPSHGSLDLAQTQEKRGEKKDYFDRQKGHAVSDTKRELKRRKTKNKNQLKKASLNLSMKSKKAKYLFPTPLTEGTKDKFLTFYSHNRNHNISISYTNLTQN